MFRTSIKVIFLLLLLVGCLGLGFQHQALAQTNSNNTTAGAVETSIGKYLCVPGKNNIITCIQQGYKFVLTISIAASVLLFVFAGYLYITGTEQSVSQAKSVIGTTIAGLAILLLTYVILKQINPELVEFKPLSPFDIQKEAGIKLDPINNSQKK